MSKKSGFTPLFSKKDIDRWVDRFQERADEKMYTILQYAGELFVKHAREDGVYDDHTGNLRSSIGYVITKYGKVLSDSFALSDKGTDRVTGFNTVQKLAKKLAATYRNGFVLIGMAGMEYAVYVEAMESKDVITSSNIKTERHLRKAIKTAFNKAG